MEIQTFYGLYVPLCVSCIVFRAMLSVTVAHHAWLYSPKGNPVRDYLSHRDTSAYLRKY